MSKPHMIYDCVIIGAGPAGLMAGIYLSRFNCNIKIIDNRDSRASLIPLSHNLPGYDRGISGVKFLQKLTKQYKQYNSAIQLGTVHKIQAASNNEYIVYYGRNRVRTKFVILATGIKDIEPPLKNLKDAIKNAQVRHCLICDGYEVSNQKVAILCNNVKGLVEAKLLSTYTKKISIFNMGQKLKISKIYQKFLVQNKIEVVDSPVMRVKIKKNKIVSLTTVDNKEYKFESIYSAFGAIPRTDLAIKLGAKHNNDRCLVVDKHQQTSVKGLYAIGDIVSGLNQICVAAAEAAIASVDIFNQLYRFDRKKVRRPDI